MDENKQKLIDLLTEKHVAYKEFFDTDTGKKIMDDLESKYYVNKSTSGLNEDIDMFTRGMREGMRTVVLYIQNMASDKQLKQLGVNDTETKGT